MSKKTVAEVLHDREMWLRKAATLMSPWFEKEGFDLPSHRIGVGFPSTGRKSKRIGECWGAEHSDDKHHEIFIHPSVSESKEVLHVLAHELCHTAVGMEAKHGKVFKRMANAIGLEGPMRATIPGDLFVQRSESLLKELGKYPHARLNTDGGQTSHSKKQKGRMLKAECPECKYIIRASRACLEIGVPPCPNPDCDKSYQNADEIIPMVAYLEDQDAEESK